MVRGRRAPHRRQELACGATISSQTAGTWCCQQPPPRKLRFRSQLSLRASRSTQVPRAASTSETSAGGSVELALQPVGGRDLREELLDVGGADRRRASPASAPAPSSPCTGALLTSPPSARRAVRPRARRGRGGSRRGRGRARGRRCRRGAAAGRARAACRSAAIDHDVVGADAADAPSGLSCWLPRPSSAALAADDADHDASRASSVEQLEQLRLARDRAPTSAPSRTASTPSSVPSSPRCAQHAARGRAGAEQRRCAAASIPSASSRQHAASSACLAGRNDARFAACTRSAVVAGRARRRRAAPRSRPPGAASSSMSTTSASRTGPRGFEA